MPEKTYNFNETYSDAGSGTYDGLDSYKGPLYNGRGPYNPPHPVAHVALLGTMARISAVSAKPLTIKARLSDPTSQIGYVYNQNGATYNQFTDIYGGGVPSGSLLALRANLYIPKAFTPTEQFRAKARLRRKSTPFYQMRSRVAFAQRQGLAARARIVHRATLDMQASVLNTVRHPLAIHMSIRNKVNRSLGLAAKVVFRDTLGAKATIFGGRVLILPVQARVFAHDNRALGAKARMISTLRGLGVRANVSYAIGARAKISIRQGWPIPAPSGGNFNFFTDTRLRFRANVKGAIKTFQHVGVKAKLRWIREGSIGIRANVNTGQSLTVRASVRPYRTTITLPVSYNVAATEQKSVRAVFYIKGNLVSPSMGMSARIERTTKKRVTAHFIVIKPTLRPGFQAIQTNFLSEGAKQTLGSVARITKP